MKKLNRRRFLYAMGALAVGGTGYGWFDSQWLEVVRRDVSLAKPAGGIRVLHLSDFHARDLFGLSLIIKAIDAGLAEKPDLICLTGDYVSHTYSGMDAYARELAKLALAAPTFSCLGNHDGGYWSGRRVGYKDRTAVLNLIQAAGIRPVENESQRLQIKGQDISVTGVGDYWAGYFYPAEAFARKKPAAVSVLLSHNPDMKNNLAPYDWDIVLCGHTHGGQARFPVLGTPFAPVADKRYISGLYPLRDRWLYITRGIGCSGVPLRINCRPEVTLLTLV